MLDPFQVSVRPIVFVNGIFTDFRNLIFQKNTESPYFFTDVRNVCYMARKISLENEKLAEFCVFGEFLSTFSVASVKKYQTSVT